MVRGTPPGLLAEQRTPLTRPGAVVQQYHSDRYQGSGWSVLPTVLPFARLIAPPLIPDHPGYDRSGLSTGAINGRPVRPKELAELTLRYHRVFNLRSYHFLLPVPIMAVEPMPELSPDADDEKLLAVVVRYYQDCLRATPDATDYLRRRGITHPGVIDHFRLGYSDRSLGLKLPQRQVKAGEAIRARLQRLGVFRDSGHEHFRGSITVPVPAADGSGRIADIYGRKVRDDLRPGTPAHVHLNDRRAGAFNVGAFGPVDEIVLCPSVWDALTFWTHGYRNVTATFGPDAPTADLLGALAEFSIKRVLTPSEAAVEKLLAAGLEVFLIRLPRGLDVNAFALTTADPADALGGLLRGAEWAGRGSPPAAPALVAPAAGDAASATDLIDADDVNVMDEPAEDAEPEPDDNSPVPFQTEPPVRTASPVPPLPPVDEAAVTANEVTLTFGSRRYRVRGLDRNATPDVLKVNLLASNGVGLHIDTFDLYTAKHRAGFQTQAAAELNVEERVVKADLGRVLLRLEDLQDARLRAATPQAPAHPEMTARDREDALALLRDPDLLDRIADAFPVVGTRANKLVAYLAAVSRKLDRPLGVVVQSASAAGKTTLVDATLALVPPEDRVSFSAVTGQGLYYLSDGSLKNKVLAVAEEAGASRASYALKLLQSEGRLTIASTGKADTGRLVTETYTVEGPVALFTTATSGDVDEELLNRCLLLTVDEDRDQTRAVHRHQRRRETLEGLLAAEGHAAVATLHQNAQRLLRPIRVVNPWAEKLTFTDASTRTRRDHAKYLALIRVVSFVRQHQRPVRTAEVGGRAVEYIETTLEDIAAANELAAVVLGRGLDDLPPQTRNLLVLLDGMATAACARRGIDRGDFRFTAREAREFTGWGHSQLKLHLKRLADREYVLARRDRQAGRYRYELAYTPDADGRAVPGLIDVDVLRHREWADDGGDRPGQPDRRPGSGRGEAGPKSGRGRAAVSTTTRTPTSDFDGEDADVAAAANEAAR